MKTVSLICLLLIVSCSSYKQKNQQETSQSYNSRPALKESFFESKLSDDQINQLLSRKLVIPKDLKIAVMKLGHEWDLTTMADFRYEREQALVVSDENSKIINEIQGKDRRIKSIAFVPQMMIPREPSIENMRKIAALMQADLLLVIHTKSRTDSRFRLLHRDEVKTVATVEATGIDIKSGVIPFTSVASESFTLKQNKDISYEELYLESALKAEDKALSVVFRNMGEFFN